VARACAIVARGVLFRDDSLFDDTSRRAVNLGALVVDAADLSFAERARTTSSQPRFVCAEA
jgi:hypothetical protein